MCNLFLKARNALLFFVWKVKIVLVLSRGRVNSLFIGFNWARKAQLGKFTVENFSSQIFIC